MRKLPTFLATVLLASGVLGVSLLKAEESAEETPAETTPELRVESSLSPAQMRAEADTKIKEMEAVLVRLVELQDIARKDKDVIKLNCVNDKLVSIKQILKLAEESKAELIQSVAQNDDDAVAHQYSQISVAKEKSDEIKDEAQGCIGKELSFVGETDIVVDGPDIVDDPTAEDDFDWSDSVDSDPPGFASPFL